jgi:hypothetical protein
VRENDITLQLVLPFSIIHSIAYCMIYLLASGIVRSFFSNVDLFLYVTLLEWTHAVSKRFFSSQKNHLTLFDGWLESSRGIRVNNKQRRFQNLKPVTIHDSKKTDSDADSGSKDTLLHDLVCKTFRNDRF